MTETLKRIAGSLAEEHCSDAIYPAHLFKAILHKEAGLVSFIESELDKDYFYLQDWADVQMQLAPKSARPMRDLDLSAQAEAVMDEAENYRLKFGLEELSPVCLLASLVTPGVGFSFDELKTLPLSASDICNAMGASVSDIPSATPAPAAGRAKASAQGNVAKYCTDKLQKAANGEISPVVGFENEIGTIFEILGRKAKSSLLITGEAGVGKSSLINKFAAHVAEGKMPEFLSGAKVYELDNSSLGADASYKGEVEDRFKKLIQEIKSTPKAILVIEQLDKLFDKQDNLFGAGQILKHELNKGGLMMLATSSIDGYTKNIETDKELLNQIEKISIDEPDAKMALRIMQGAMKPYEEFHGISVDTPTLENSIRLAKRYLTEKALPDSAFGLIDRTMAQLKTMNSMTGDTIAELSAKLETIKGADPESPSLMADLEWLNYELENKINCILLAELDGDDDFSKMGTAQERIAYLERALAKLAARSTDKRTWLLNSDVEAVVAKQTGVPLGKVQTAERDRLLGAEETLKKRVIGQDHAVKKVLDSVFESRSGLNKKGQPMGSFFFLGPTGTGKTELSKALAAFLFGDESALLRFDMSEFKEEHSVALLYGAPPGYVGYEEGGLLVNKIRQKPYSVVLFDEIEKAHKSVFDLFLQILDEGKLHDRLGRMGDFSNAILLFTSNIGSKFIVDKFNSGLVPENNDLMEIMQDFFRPEFLGRLTEIVPFSPITEQTVVKIFDVHLKGLLKLLGEQDITLSITDDVKRRIAMMGFNPQYGARPIIGIIRKQLRQPLSKLIISGKVKPGDTVEVTVGTDGTPQFNVKQQCEKNNI